MRRVDSLGLGPQEGATPPGKEKKIGSVSLGEETPQYLKKHGLRVRD
jgi:hypothetical protein